MVKVLVCGNVEDENWSLLVTRLEELQFSNHGPFDLLIMAKPLTTSYDVISSTFERLEKLEIQICAFSLGSVEAVQWPTYWIVQNKLVGIFNAPKNLTVAYVFNDQFAEQDSEINAAIHGLGYRGCDFLITDKWPADCARHLNENDFQEYQNLRLNDTVMSKVVTTFASNARPRYHIVAGLGFFYQRPPYLNQRINNTPQMFTRLISIDSVSSSKDKNKKWLHALSITPIIYMKVADLEEAPSSFTECPYNNSGSFGGDSSIERPQKRLRHLEGNSTTNSFFFDGVSSSSLSTQLNIQPSGDAKTLFIGGLSKDWNERDLKRILPDVMQVRRIVGKSYAFAEFSDHESAAKVFQNANKGYGLILNNRKLSVGWSSSRSEDKSTADIPSNFDVNSAMKYRELIPPSEEAKTLFIGNLPNIVDVDVKLRILFDDVVSVKTGKLFAFVEFESFDKAMAVITKSINEQIKLNDVPLVVGWAKSPKLQQKPVDCRVLFIGNIPLDTAQQDIEKVCDGWTSVRRPAGRDYAFVEFDTPEQALECSQNLISKNVHINGNVLKVGWAKGKAADRLDQSMDCWFCLASPSVKIHLIVTVGNYNYLAIPRGGITNSHVLVCPIDCVPSRIHLSAESRLEEEKFCDAVKQMFLAKNCAMLLFERALRTTNSRDHMQIQLIPIPFDKLSGALDVFADSSKRHNVNFHEFEDGKSVEDVVLAMEGGPYQEYFYMEVPYDTDQPFAKKKFVYVHDDPKSKFPMFFGSEVAANLIGKPERSNWKNCVLSENDEIKLVEEIRESFSPFDFTCT